MSELVDTGARSKLRELWRELFYIDLRSLALFRICM